MGLIDFFLGSYISQKMQNNQMNLKSLLKIHSDTTDLQKEV